VIAKIRDMELNGILPADGAKVIITATLSDWEAVCSTYDGLCDACLAKPVTRAKMDPLLARWGWSLNLKTPHMRILIAEDNATSRAILQKSLATAPCLDVLVANDGQEAWLLMEKGLVPDLCIIDNLMPNLSGVELLEKMRRDLRLREVPVMFCTAANERSTVVTAANLNIRAYLLKPIVPDAVLDMVETLRKEIVAGHELRRRKGWT
jgi:two-component system chemotaxis response regulator CheY